jgi:hypothetical protein
MPNTLDGIELSEDLQWADRHKWSPVVQNTSHAVDGSLIVEVGTMLSGRKISLVGDSSVGWMGKTQVDALYAKAVVAGLVMSLVFRGQTYSVMFNHEQGALDIDQGLPYTSDIVDVGETLWMKVNSINLIGL